MGHAARRSPLWCRKAKHRGACNGSIRTIVPPHDCFPSQAEWQAVTLRGGKHTVGELAQLTLQGGASQAGQSAQLAQMKAASRARELALKYKQLWLVEAIFGVCQASCH